MLSRKSPWIVLPAVAFVLAILPAERVVADGFIVIDRPVPMPHPIRPVPPWRAFMPLEVKNHHVTCTIRDTVGVTKIDQVFHNPNTQQMEGTYLFPLPETASVQQFSMWMNGKEMHGELLDAEQARKTYEDIVRTMKDPALLEYVGSRLYRARVFPIPANGDVRIALEYSETISVDDGLAVYQYPLNTEKFSARDIERVTITVDIHSEIPLKSVFCASHDADISRPDKRTAKVGFEARHVRPDQDFVVYYQMSETEFGVSLLSYKPIGEDGFFMARIAPPLDVSDDRIMPKDVCFVLDTSGSMAGDKIEQARRAMRFCLSSLHKQDRFNIISFATDTRPFRDTLVPANAEQLEAARDEIDRMKAAGGTNINAALLAAIAARSDRDADRPYMIVFVTDGEPTVDVRDPDEIRRNVTKANDGHCRLFVFGVGHDLNTKLLDRLAEENRGTREYIGEHEDIELKVSRFFKKVSDPALSDVVLECGAATIEQVYPKVLPDLFHGSELVVIGRYRTPGRHTIRVSGKDRGERRSWAYDATFADARTDNEFLPRLWATRKIGYLMDEIRLHGENSELKDEIVRLAKRYAIITPYTSYLVVEDSARAPMARAAGRRGESFARRLSDVRTKSGAFGADMDAAKEFADAESGRVAVRASREAQSMTMAQSAVASPVVVDALKSLGDASGSAGEGQPASPQDVVKIVGTKTFYFDDGRWLDSEYDEATETKKIQAFSDAYFELVRHTPVLGKYLALGQRVVVVVAGTAYEITE